MRLVNKLHVTFLIGIISLFSVISTHAQSVTALFHQPNDPVAGNPKGRVTIVEFFDYGCEHCLTMSNTVAAIIRNNPNVRVVFKETPLNGPLTEYATRAALAANKQGKYYQFSHALLANRTRLSKEKILRIAKNNGIDIEKLKTAMYEPSITNQIKGNYQLWRNFRLTGTPSFFIGKTDAASLRNVRYVLGEMSQREMQYAIDSAR